MKLVFDIGCNRGEFSQACLHEYPDCSIIAVDANFSSMPTAGVPENVTLVNALVSDGSEEFCDFYVDKWQTGISTASTKYMQESRFAKGSKYLEPKSGKWDYCVKVATTTLDSLISDYGSPDLIKIDVEGFEYEVVAGLSSKPGKICFEWHEEDLDTLYNCVDHLINLGYESFGIIGYFDEGDVFERLTYSGKGDPYMQEPNNYYNWPALRASLQECCDPDRRVNYGMFFVK